MARPKLIPTVLAPASNRILIGEAFEDLRLGQERKVLLNQPGGSGFT